MRNISSTVGDFSPHLSRLAYVMPLWFIATHGIRTIDNLRKFCGIEDPDKLEVKPVVTPLVVSGDSHPSRSSRLHYLSGRLLRVPLAVEESSNFLASTPS